MKLLSLNAWTGRTKRLLADYIEAEAADIACLQEVLSISGNPGFFRSSEQLQSQAGYKHGFFSPTFSFRYMRRTAAHGNAILSRRPLREPTTHYTHLSYIRNFDYDHDSYDVRCLQHAVVTISDVPCHILNYQGHHVKAHKHGDEHSLAHSQQIADYIGGLFGPVILAGDFNLAPDSPALAPLNRLLRNLSVEHALTTTRTDLTAKAEVCDYVFVNSGVVVRDFRTADVLVSDHRPLILEFDI